MNIATYETSDLSLAVYLLWKGQTENIPPWKRDDSGNKPKVVFRFCNIDSNLINEYRSDVDGIQRYNGLRRTYLRIISTELGD